jgi:uncharacterized protein (TIGR02246 family)
MPSGSVEDRLAIRELVESYNHAVMRFDADAWARNWTDDAVWSLPGLGEVQGRDRIVGMWTQAMAALTVDGFFASAGEITVEGDTATGVWYQQEFLRGADGTGERFVIGEYHDSYRRVDGAWRFSARRYSVRFSRAGS